MHPMAYMASITLLQYVIAPIRRVVTPVRQAPKGSCLPPAAPTGFKIAVKRPVLTTTLSDARCCTAILQSPAGGARALPVGQDVGRMERASLKICPISDGVFATNAPPP